jgi:hypothetical protein
MQGHDAVLALAVRLSLIAFMVGSLLDMGLELRLRDALAGLGNRPFLLPLLVGMGVFALAPRIAAVLRAWARGAP